MYRLLFTTGFVAAGMLGACKDRGAAPPNQTPSVEAIAQTPAAAIGANPSAAAPGDPSEAGPTIDHKVRMLDGKDASLSDWRGHTLLIVNTASECGLTPQYEELEALYQRYSGRGLVVMGFPSNDFGGQEPGDSKQIGEFVAKTFGITFPMFDKQVVKGANKSPLYKTLTEGLSPTLRGEIKWNFEKFLVGPDGKVIARFAPKTTPLDPAVTAAIEANLPPPAK